MIGHLQAKVAQQTAAHGSLWPIHSDKILEVFAQPPEWRGCFHKDPVAALDFALYIQLHYFLSKSLFAGEMVVKRPLRHIGLIQDLFDASRVVSNGAHTSKSDFQETVTGRLDDCWGSFFRGLHARNRLVY